MTTKLQLLKSNLPAECVKHGQHSSWKIYNKNNVQCDFCLADRQRKYRTANPLKYLLRDAQNRQDRWACNLDLEYLNMLLLKQNSRCALSNIEFSIDRKPSLDRIDSSIGYIRGNVQLVLFEVNRMKSDLVQDRFIELCTYISSIATEKKK